MLILICFIVLAQAYLFSWIIPQYQMLVANTTSIIPDFTKGYVYLLVLVGVIVAFAAAIFVLLKKKSQSV